MKVLFNVLVLVGILSAAANAVEPIKSFKCNDINMAMVGEKLMLKDKAGDIECYTVDATTKVRTINKKLSKALQDKCAAAAAKFDEAASKVQKAE